MVKSTELGIRIRQWTLESPVYYLKWLLLSSLLVHICGNTCNFVFVRGWGAGVWLWLGSQMGKVQWQEQLSVMAEGVWGCLLTASQIRIWKGMPTLSQISNPTLFIQPGINCLLGYYTVVRLTMAINHRQFTPCQFDTPDITFNVAKLYYTTCYLASSYSATSYEDRWCIPSGSLQCVSNLIVFYVCDGLGMVCFPGCPTGQWLFYRGGSTGTLQSRRCICWKVLV